MSNPDAEESSFIDLLEATKSGVLKEIKGIRRPGSLSGQEFEGIVFHQAQQKSSGTAFEGQVEQTKAQDFPDIIAKRYFGIEVKATKQDHWSSTGNSISESTRKVDVKRIYMFFGKLGGSPDIMYRPYADCLASVVVTHNPRYSIKMRLPDENSIFDKMNLTYDELRNHEEPIKVIKDYLRTTLTPGQELWWLDHTVSPVIRSYSDLSNNEQEDFLNAVMGLYPEIYGTSTKKYERIPAFLLNKYNAVSSNIRDKFSASGRVSMNLNGSDVSVERKLYNLSIRAQGVREAILASSKDTLSASWSVDRIKADRIGQFKELLDNIAGPLDDGLCASDIFEAGLQ